MIRFLYRCLLWLHPARFRRQFAAEMLWIFDETGEPRASWTLLVDGLTSLARQWLLRSGSWKVAAALALAVMQVTLGGFGMLLFGRRSLGGLSARVSTSEYAHRGLLAYQPITVEIVMYLAVLVTGGLMLMVIGLALWQKSFAARRRGVLLRVR